VLLAARDLDEALADGNADEVTSLSNRLLLSALGRESGGAVAGFQPDDSRNGAAAAPTARAAPATVEQELSLALTELELGQVLLTSAAATAAPQQEDRAKASSDLGDAIDGLDTAAGYLAEPGAPAVSGFLGSRQPNPEAFFDQLPKTVTGIIDRTAQLGVATVKGLSRIPVAQLEPAFGAAWSAAETTVGTVAGVGALVQAGLRAIARAVRALAELVPEKLREQVRGWAGDWWDQHAEHAAESLARRVLSAAALEDFLAERLKDARKRTDLDSSLTRGYSLLVDLDGRHTRISSVLGRIVAALSRLIGPLALAFPAAAPWVYASGGGGVVTALGVSVWIGRDYFDAGVPFERVPGVRAIVTEAIVAPVLNG
jgi:hypothetical protein